MDKDTLKKKINEKAQRIADKKIEELVKYIEQNFSYDAKKMILSGSIWGSGDSEKNFRAKVLENEIENNERDFYQKVESLFYHLGH